jgi:hypothetical protein
MINFVYCLFFLLLNAFLYSTLIEFSLLNKYVKIGVFAFFLIIIVIHLANLKLPNLMNSSDFYEIFIFSPALVFFYFLFKFSTFRIDLKKKYNHLNYIIIKILKNGLLFKIYYLMITIYQTLTILKR